MKDCISRQQPCCVEVRLGAFGTRPALRAHRVEWGRGNPGGSCSRDSGNRDHVVDSGDSAWKQGQERLRATVLPATRDERQASSRRLRRR
jgi:hypothetical protein